MYSVLSTGSWWKRCFVFFCFVSSGRLIQHFCERAPVRGADLSLRAVHGLCELWISPALEAFLLPGLGGKAADSTFSSLHPSSSIPPSLHPPVSCLHSAALRLCHLGDTPDHQGPGGHLDLAGRRRSPWELREVLPWVEKRCWWWLSGGEFFFFTQAGRRLKVWLHVAWPGLKMYAFCIVRPGDLPPPRKP